MEGDRERVPGYVIAIAGTAGSGKTTLVRAVTTLLGEATALYFDDYESTSTYPPDWGAWLRAGADPDVVRTPQLAADLRALRHGTAVTTSDGRRSCEPAAYVVLDEPFGRARAELRDLVDFVACIEVPLEVALARRLLRAVEEVQDDACLREEVRLTARTYLTREDRALYLAATALAEADCELILDGMASPEQLARHVVQAVRARRARATQQASGG
ncbi:MAG TPA: hypothetical protein VHS99_25840 [Chloroflexota bacterium]|nr:hypothetical protein [Chloroflexota bacterium]